MKLLSHLINLLQKIEIVVGVKYCQKKVLSFTFIKIAIHPPLPT